MRTYNQVIQDFNDIATSHNQIHSFGHGMDFDINTSGTVHYPMLWIEPRPFNIEGTVLTMKFAMYIMGTKLNGKLDETEVISDTLNITLDVLAQLKHKDYFFNAVKEATMEQFTAKFDDDLAGWETEISLRFDYEWDRCAIPGTPTISTTSNTER